MSRISDKTPQTKPFLPGKLELADPLCRVVLVEPLIPENTGNISRTCVGTESELHLVGPLGFEITESRVKRAGLDYWPHLALAQHENWQSWCEQITDPHRVFFIETWGEANLHEAEFKRGDTLVFGKETTGLDQEQVRRINIDVSKQVLRLPMTGPVRSLNLSNAVAAAVFELLRQVQKKR